MTLVVEPEELAPAAPERQTKSAPAPRWRTQYAHAVVLLDIVSAAVAFTTAAVLRFGLSDAQLAAAEGNVSYRIIVLGLIPCWLALLALSGAYDVKHVGSGPDEYRGILNSAVRFVALTATVSYFFKIELARGLLGVAVPIAFAGTVAGRHAVRHWMARHRCLGRFTEDVLVVGTPQSVIPLVRHFRRTPDAGFTVMGAVIDGGLLALDVDGEAVPILGEPDNLFDVIANTDADAIAVADTRTLPTGAVRDLSWHLEGSGIDLLVAPAITDVAGPRVAVRPIAGLPVLHVVEPEFEGARRVLKRAFDFALAGVAVVLLAPLFGVVALLIRFTSDGPVFFRQIRVGRGGEEFCIWKFRTMRTDAEMERIRLEHLNEHEGVLFKIREDPRVTRAGKVLRRLSIDELPQLFNVLRGEMSLVGPRPPIPKEVGQYGHDVRRRLLVKPGLTGLWQVSGRSDLSWEESVRLDLYYVENWSPALDISILWKTAAAVVTARGAY